MDGNGWQWIHGWEWMVIYGNGKSKPFICVFVLTLATCFKLGFLLSITWKRQQMISKKYKFVNRSAIILQPCATANHQTRDALCPRLLAANMRLHLNMLDHCYALLPFACLSMKGWHIKFHCNKHMQTGYVQIAVFSRNHHNNQPINQRSNISQQLWQLSSPCHRCWSWCIAWMASHRNYPRKGSDSYGPRLSQTEWCCQDQEQWKWDVMMCLRVGQFRWNEPPTYPGLQRRKIYSNIWTTVYLIVLTDR